MKKRKNMSTHLRITESLVCQYKAVNLSEKELKNKIDWRIGRRRKWENSNIIVKEIYIAYGKLICIILKANEDFWFWVGS